MQLGGDPQAVALALEPGALEAAAARPLVEHHQRVAGDALDVRAGLRGVALGGHADHAQDHALGELRALEHHRRHRREVLGHALVVGAEARVRPLARVEELQHAEDHVRGVAQRHREHGARAVARHRVVALVEPERRRRVERVGVRHVDGLPAHRAPAGDRAGAHRHHQAREPRAGVPARLLQRVVLAEGEPQRLALADVDGAGVRADHGARLAQDALHEEVEVVDAAQLDAQARDRVEPRAHDRRLALAGARAARAAGLVGVAQRVAQLPLQAADRAHRVVALGARVERLGVLLDARAELDRVGELLHVVRGARVEHGAAQLRVLRLAEDDHGQGGRLGPAAEAPQQVEGRRAPADLEVEKHHRRVDLERLHLGVAHGVAGMDGDVPVRRAHGADAAGEPLVGGHQQHHRRRRRERGGLLGRGHPGEGTRRGDWLRWESNPHAARAAADFKSAASAGSATEPGAS